MWFKKNLILFVSYLLLLCTPIFASPNNLSQETTPIAYMNFIDEPQISIDNYSEIQLPTKLDISIPSNIILGNIQATDIDSSSTQEISTTTPAAIQLNDYNKLMKTSNLPELVLENITYNTKNYPFAEYDDASLYCIISNIGNTPADNVFLGIYVNDSFIGAIDIGTLEYSKKYAVPFILSGIPAGKHKITVTVDYYNTISEPNKDNNTKSNVFEWIRLPDLIANISSIPDISETPAKSDVKYEFTVSNIGKGIATGPFNIKLLIENGVDTLERTFEIASLNPGATCSSNFSINVGEGSVVNAKVIADSSDVLREIDKNNNVATHTCKLTYSEYNLGSYTSNWAHTKYAENGNGKPSKTTPSIYIDSSAYKLYELSEFDAVKQWNNISSNLTIADPTTTNSSADIRIVTYPLNGNTLGDTNPNPDNSNFTWTKIKLTNNKNLFSSSQLLQRTIAHEMGHALGLAHPNENIDKCPYTSIMWQSTELASGKATYSVTNADKYNIQILYGE